jgi:integrase
MKTREGNNPCDGTKRKYIYAYEQFCKEHQIPFDKPKYKYKAPIPLIPSTENVNLIIANASKKYATIFKIMTETAIEGEELSLTHKNQIDEEKGNISVIGIKGHTNGTYNLTTETTQMLREYMNRYKNREYPFPTSKTMGNTWRTARAKASKKLCKPELNKIPFKNLRNYAGAIFYYTHGKDTLETMMFMRHKKLQTTYDYLRGIRAFTPTFEYTTIKVKTGTETTIDEVIKLSTTGFKKFDEIDGYHIYRKPK